MPANRVHFALFLFSVVVAVIISPQGIHAQGCSSCQNSQPAASYYQPTTVYQMSGTAVPYYNGNACNTCQPAVQPVQVQPLYQTPAAYRPIPRTSYRTEWIPNTITYYSPNVGVNPTTGAPVVSYRACQTQGQILQRLPTFGLFSSPATSYAPSAGCSTCAPTATIAPAATTTIPYSSAPYTSAPYTSAPYTVPPATLSPSPTPATTTVPGPARTTSPENNVPAETRPSLKPEARTNAQGASIRGFESRPTFGSDFDASPNTTEPSLNSPSRSIRVTPVPDPDAARANEQPQGDAPQLLDPRQKTAALPSNFIPTYTPVAWPTVKPAPYTVETITNYKRAAKPPSLSAGWKTVAW